MLDASGQALVYVYARETRAEADIAKVLTLDEARCLPLEDKCRNTELLTYSIEPVAFNILGTSSSIVSKPGFVWCADARRFVDGGADTLRITSLPCEEH